MKWKEPCPGFEPESLCQFTSMITITLRVTFTVLCQHSFVVAFLFHSHLLIDQKIDKVVKLPGVLVVVCFPV